MATNQESAAPSSLMKGKLHQSTRGNFHVTESSGMSDTASEVQDRQVGFDFSNGHGNGTSHTIDFLQDDKRDMTWGRRIALSLCDQKWYNPRAGGNSDSDGSGGDNKDEGQGNNGCRKNGYGSEEAGDETFATETPSEERRKSILSEENPTVDDDFDTSMSNSQPNLAKAWAYFEHVALYRYLVNPEDLNKPKKNICIRIFRKFFCKANKRLERAEPGENGQPTRLYDPIFTPHKQLGDFGLGIGLYFSTLRAITFITLIAGLISVYNIQYFASEAYLAKEFRDGIDSLQQGSAICTDTAWVPCPTCNCTAAGETRQLFGFLPADRCAVDEAGNLTFALRNNCDGTPWQLAAVNYSTVIWLMLATFLLGIYLRRQEIAFDEDEQTAQDYSVLVTNPPEDAKDPEEWRRFFEENFNGAQLTVCTIAVDNDLLVQTLVERRERLRTIHNMQEPGSSMKMLDLARVAAEQERERGFWGRVMALVVPGIPEHFARLVALNAKVEGLAQLAYPATNVFLTFETEKDQRHVLENLSVGKIKADRNDARALSDPKFLFRGEHVLAVEEPDEPNTVRWQDLNAGAWKMFKERCLTTLCTLISVALAAVCVNFANNASTVGAAFTIAAFNSVFPMLAKFLTSFESHASEGRKQTSLYSKIALFRWIGSAVIIAIITPFTNTLSFQNGLITQVYALFFADIVTTNGLALADPFGHLQRHFLAPRASTQDAQNLLFAGTQYELAERYTDMTKILFLALWYCSIYPGAFFMCSFSLGIKYFVDRFCLMRVWKKAPALGTKISSFSRQYFFSLALVAMAIFSSYYWSGFPFDNICPNESIDQRYENVTRVFPLDDSYDGSGEQVGGFMYDYRFCNQDFLAIGSGVTFPFVPANGREWMTTDQITTTTYFGWSAIAILAIVVLKFVFLWWSIVQDMYTSSYKAVGDDQNMPYSEVESRSAYIPQVVSPIFSYPLLACNTDNIDEELYDWADHDRTYGYYDLTKDAQKLLVGMNVEKGAGFSIVTHWPPDQQQTDG